MKVTVWDRIKCKVTVSYFSSCKRKKVRAFQRGGDPELVTHPELAAQSQWHRPSSELAAV